MSTGRKLTEKDVVKDSDLFLRVVYQRVCIMRD